MSIVYIGMEVIHHNEEGGVVSTEMSSKFKVKYNTVGVDILQDALTKITTQVEEEYNPCMPIRIKHIYMLDE